ncbi:MAG: GNAT family N-acetyltransferase [Parvularculaceae bacterium]|nr:GNAT family N-acetyltransferase [Parvularculaceae bacterium]
MKAQVEIVSDIERLKADWARLYTAAPKNFFQSPCWFDAWCAMAHDHANLVSVRIDGGAGPALAMAVMGRPRRQPGLGFRQARLCETGDEEPDRIYIEYNDILVADGAPPEVRRLALSELVNAQPGIEEFVFRNARAPLVEAVREVANANPSLALEVVRRETTVTVDLGAGDWAALAPLSKSARAKVNRAHREYSARGAMELSLAQGEDERRAAWAALCELHNTSWRTRGEEGALENRAVASFMETMLRDHPDNIDLYCLRAGGEFIGVLYNLVEGDVASNYQSGFRFEADNRLAPGFLAHALAAADYQRRGFAEYDLLGGAADYKLRFGAPGETLTTLTLTRRGLKHSSRRVLKGLRRDAKTHRT